MKFLRHLPLPCYAPETAGAGGGAAAAGAAAAAGGGPGAGGAGGAAGGAAGAAAAGANGAAKPFAEMLPADIRGEPVFKDIKDLDALARSYHGQAKLIGVPKEQLLMLPKGADDAEGYDRVFKALGRPDKPEGYKIPALPAGKDGKAPEYSEADKAFQAKMLPALHKAGLTQAQIDAIVPQWNTVLGEQRQAISDAEKAAMGNAEKELRTAFGQAYDAKLQLAKEAINHYQTELKLGDKFAIELERTGLGNHPAIAQMFAHLGTMLKEDGVVGKGGAAAGGALSPAEARQQIAAKFADPAFMATYTKKTAPGHAEAIANMTRLHEALVAAEAAEA